MKKKVAVIMAVMLIASCPVNSIYAEEVNRDIENSEEDIFIIGGAKIYEEFLPYVENIYLTEIDAESLADVYFPNFDKNNFNKEILATNEEKGIKYQMCLYRKKV